MMPAFDSAMSGVWMRTCAPSTPALRGEGRHRLERRNERGPAVGVARVVDGVDADDQVARADAFRPRQGQRQKDRVARRHVGRRDAGSVERAVLRHAACPDQRRSAEGREIDPEFDVARHSQRARHSPGGLHLDGVALAVGDRQRKELEAVGARDGGGGVGIEAPAEQDDRSPGGLTRHGRALPRCTCAPAAAAGRAGRRRESTPRGRPARARRAPARGAPPRTATPGRGGR